MKLHVEWERPIALKDASKDNVIYSLALGKAPKEPGGCIFERRAGPAGPA